MARAIAEQAPDHAGMPILEVLPTREADFYSAEADVVDMCGKSKVILEQLYDQYWVVGGNMNE
jgi:hypothetical protein